MKIASGCLSLLATLALFAPSVSAAERPARSLSLRDCIELALQHNVDVQVERYNPDIARFDLGLAYAGWEPAFNGSFTHSYSLSPGGLDSQNRHYQGSESDTHSFSAGVSGLMPWGTTYNLGISGSDSYGTSPAGFVTNVVNGNTNVVPIRTPFENTSSRVGALTLSQPLLRNAWVDSTRLRIATAKKNLKFSEYGLRGRINDTVLAVQSAYYDLIAARENVTVQEQALELAERLLEENRKRVQVGALAPLDEKQSESQAAASRADLLAARQNLSTRENVLKSLLTDDYGKWHDVDIVPQETLRDTPEKFDLQESWRKGLTLRPDLLQARINVEKQDITLRYSRNQLLPQLDVVGSIGYTGSGQEFSDAFGQIANQENPFWSVGAVLNIPLGNRSARENYHVDKATKAQLVLQLKGLEQSVMVQIDNAVKLAQSGFERVDATRQAHLYAEAALNAEQKKLENGKSTSFQVLQLQKDLTAARSSEIQALADYNKALAALAHDEGTILEKNQFTLDLK